MLFAIPSKGRPGLVKSQRVLPSARVYVPESEVADYVRLGTQNVVGVPDAVRGITRTRNYILEHADDARVVMVDDDVKSQGFRKLLHAGSRPRALSEAEWIREARMLFDMTEQFGFRLWGVGTDGAMRSVHPWKPFLTRGYIVGSFMGILNDGRTRFDESFDVKEDYELCMRCVLEDGGVLAARHVWWASSHWNDEGGCSSYRTQLAELRAIQALTKKFPGMVRRVVRGGSRYSIEVGF